MGTRGILGTKLGMTQVFDDEGRIIPVTVVHASPNTVTQVKRVETDGYTAVQLAFGARKHVSRPMAGHLAKARVAPGRGDPGLRQVPGQRLRDVLPGPVGQLDGRVAVGPDALDLGHRVGRRVHDRDRDDAALVVEDLRHPELGAEDAPRAHVVVLLRMLRRVVVRRR